MKNLDEIDKELDELDRWKEHAAKLAAEVELQRQANLALAQIVANMEGADEQTKARYAAAAAWDEQAVVINEQHHFEMVAATLLGGLTADPVVDNLRVHVLHATDAAKELIAACRGPAAPVATPETLTHMVYQSTYDALVHDALVQRTQLAEARIAKALEEHDQRFRNCWDVAERMVRHLRGEA